MKKELQRNQRRLVTEVGLERAGQGENVETPLLLMEVSFVNDISRNNSTSNIALHSFRAFSV